MLEAIAGWPGAEVLRQAGNAYILVNAAHIFSIGLLIGAIVVLDLRILGIVGRWPLEVMGVPLTRFAMAGIVLAIATGAWLFSVRPAIYLANPAFSVKLALLALALANALVVHLGRHWRRAARTGDAGPALKVQAGLSLLLWPSVLLAGRWIGFV